MSSRYSWNFFEKCTQVVVFWINNVHSKIRRSSYLKLSIVRFLSLGVLITIFATPVARSRSDEERTAARVGNAFKFKRTWEVRGFKQTKEVRCPFSGPASGVFAWEKCPTIPSITHSPPWSHSRKLFQEIFGTMNFLDRCDTIHVFHSQWLVRSWLLTEHSSDVTHLILFLRYTIFLSLLPFHVRVLSAPSSIRAPLNTMQITPVARFEIQYK